MARWLAGSPTRSRARRGAVLGTVLLSTLLAVTSCVLPPGARPTNPPLDSGTIANPVPSDHTPDFDYPSAPAGVTPEVTAIAQVAGRVVVGGSFTSVTSHPTSGSSITVARNFLMAYRLDTSQIDGGFRPVVDGEVDAIEPSANRAAVYVAGKFKHSGGNNGTRPADISHVALFDVHTGKPVPGFAANVFGGNVLTMQLVGSHLLIGGYFTSVSGVARAGLASLNATTGRVEPYFALSLRDPHNAHPVPGITNQVGATSIAVSPNGRRAIVGGNFRHVSDPVQQRVYTRDQLVSINLNALDATVDTTWNTNAYTSICSNNFAGYLNDIGWAPNGSYFVVTATGGYPAGSFRYCDSASRFNASSTGLNVLPAWSQRTGADSLYAVAVTSAAVYVGGHNRWLNNPYGSDSAGSGAVPRPGLAALEPANGLPMAWNPGHNPRGHGITVMYVTPTGLFIGSDKDCVGFGANDTSCSGYERRKIAFFPFAGGSAPVPSIAGSSAKVFHGGSFGSASDALGANLFNAARGTGVATTAPSNPVPWSQVRGAFTLNKRIYYGKADGHFYVRGFDGKTIGTSEFRIDPYNDPFWDGKLTGLGSGSGQTYDGVASSFYAEIPHITGMFFANRSIYYTVDGDARLFRRDFSPGTQMSTDPTQLTGGVIGAVRLQVVQNGGIVNLSNAGGMFVANGFLWYASRGNGRLYRAAWNGTTVTSHATLVPGAFGTWSGRAVFLAP